MNFSQRLGLFCLILISIAYIYFSYFNKEGFRFNIPSNNHQNEINENTYAPEEDEPAVNDKKEVKTVKIYVTDSKGNLHSLTRKCDTGTEKSCFNFAIRELIQGPTNWEKSKGFSSEIPTDTKILSIREGGNNILIDLSSAFESGGGAESIYIRIKQLIKTAKSNTSQPVFLYINGKQADVIGGEGIMIKQPLSERSLDE